MNAENENKDTSSDSSASVEESTAEKSSAETTVEEKASDAPAAPTESGAQNAIEIAKTSSQADTLTGRREDRRNWMDNVNKTCDYIGKISSDKSLHFRASDKITSRLLIGAFLLSMGFATLPWFEMNAIAAFAYVLADILLCGAILVFVVSRFGIIRAMEPRHALVCWHLMVGTGLLALVVGFNVVATVVLFMMRERLQLLFPGG